MKTTTILGLTLLCAASANAQNRQITTRAARNTTTCTAPAKSTTARLPNAEQQQYDVVLDVPSVCVERIHLRVKNLNAHVALDAVVANLVTIQAGADVAIGTVDLVIEGVEVQAELLVDLDNVATITDNVFNLIDAHPEIIQQLYQTTQNAAGALGQTVNALGQTVLRSLDGSGQILERTLDTAGKLVGEKVVGSVTSLPVLKEVAGSAAGSVVRQVKDTAGALIEYTLDKAGRITNAHVISSAPGK